MKKEKRRMLERFSGRCIGILIGTMACYACLSAGQPLLTTAFPVAIACSLAVTLFDEA